MMPEETVMPPKHASSQPDWSAGQYTLAVLTGVLCVALAIPSFLVLFFNVLHLLQPFMDHWAWTVPACTEIGFVAIYLIDVLLTWRGKQLGWLRLVPPVLAGFSLWLNIYAAHGILPSMVGHAVVTIVFFGTLTIAKIAVKRLIRPVGEVRDRIPAARWLLFPVQAWKMFRRMVDEEINSYSRAVTAEIQWRRDIAAVEAHYGARWQAEAPSDLTWMLTRRRSLDEAHARVVLLTQNAPAVPARKASGSAGATSSQARASSRNIPVPAAPAAPPPAVPGTGEPVPPGTVPARSGNGDGNSSQERAAVPVRRLRDTAELLSWAREINGAWRVTHGRDISIDALYERMKPIRRQTVSDLLRQLRAENAPPVASGTQEGAR